MGSDLELRHLDVRQQQKVAKERCFEIGGAVDGLLWTQWVRLGLKLVIKNLNWLSLLVGRYRSVPTGPVLSQVVDNTPWSGLSI